MGRVTNTQETRIQINSIPTPTI